MNKIFEEAVNNYGEGSWEGNIVSEDCCGINECERVMEEGKVKWIVRGLGSNAEWT